MCVQVIFFLVSKITKLCGEAMNRIEYSDGKNSHTSCTDTDAHLMKPKAANIDVTSNSVVTTSRYIPILSLQCDHLIRVLRSRAIHSHSSPSSLSSSSSSSSSSSVTSWLSWLLSSIPFQTSENFLRSLSTEELLDLMHGESHADLRRTHKLNRIELLDYPYLASTVLVSHFIRSSPSSTGLFRKSLDSGDQHVHIDDRKDDKKRLFSSYWSKDIGTSNKKETERSANKDMVDMCVSDLRMLFMMADLKARDIEAIGARLGTGIGTGIGTPQKTKDPLLYVFDAKCLRTSYILSGMNDIDSYPKSRSLLSPRYHAGNSFQNINHEDLTFHTDTVGKDVQTLREERSGYDDETSGIIQGPSYLQLQLIGAMGWGLLPCFCAQPISACKTKTSTERTNDDGIDDTGKKREDEIIDLIDFDNEDKNSKLKGDRADSVVDIGKGAAAIKDILQKILDGADTNQEKDIGDLLSRNSRNVIDKTYQEEQKKMPAKAMSIHFCVTLLASCLTSTSTVGAKAGRCSSTSTSTSTTTTSSLRPLVRKLAAGVGPIALSFLIKILGRCIKEELEVPCQESESQRVESSITSPGAVQDSCIKDDRHRKSREHEREKESGADLGVYLACLQGTCGTVGTSLAPYTSTTHSRYDTRCYGE